MDETRVNASHLARVVGFILALVLFTLVIWFVVQISQDENGVVVTNDEENAITSVTEGLIGGGEVVVVDGSGSQIAATDAELESALTASDGSAVAGTAVANLLGGTTPETGPVDTTLSALAIGLAAVAYSKYRASKLEAVYPV